METASSFLFFGVFCFVPIVIVAVFGMRSRMRFAKDLQKMNVEERKVFLKKNTNFNLIVVSGFSVLVLGIVIALIFRKEILVQYISLGLLGFVLIMSIIGQVFIYHVPKDK